MKFNKINEPIKIGSKIAKNRIFMPPLSTNLGNKGYVTDELVAHYKRRAKGGVALFITEVVTIEPTYTYLPGDMSIYDDSFIDGWKKLIDGVHEYNSLILPQLFHPAYMAYPLPGTPRLIAPSWIGPSYLKESPREVSILEIKEIIKKFGDAAYRVKLAGGDGVEIHAAHAHGLLGGFLSPYYNKRCDEYGGDLTSRLRLTLEVISEVRNRCGKDFIIDVRISGDDYFDGGNNLTDMIYVAKRLEQASVDMIHVSGGMTILRGSSIPPSGTKMGSHQDAAKEIKKHVSIPVITVGRILEPWIANELIENEVCDAVLIGRANLCDPDFANKAISGNTNDIRPCIGCLKCLNGIMFGKKISCSVNPSFDLVNEDTISLSKEKKNILVVGAGPAGLECAYILKKRGHNVVILERDSKPGGLLKAASVPIAKNDLTKLTKYLYLRVLKEDIDVKFNTLVTKELIKEKYSNYEIVLSCGSEPLILDSLNKYKLTATCEDVLLGKVNPGRKVVIIGGGLVGCETADYLAPLINDLAPRNRDITIIETLTFMMMNGSGANRTALMMRLQEKGVKLINNAKVTNISNDKIVYEVNNMTYEISDADSVLLAVGYKPNEKYINEIKKLGNITYVIGDSIKAGSVKEAITSAFELAKNI